MRIKSLLACAGVLLSQIAVADVLPQHWVSAGDAFSEWVKLGREGRVLVIDPTLLVGGLGPRVPEALSTLSKAFYPSSQMQAAELQTTESNR
jgi:ABC-type hemin transport system substrate-binding protein